MGESFNHVTSQLVQPSFDQSRIKPFPYQLITCIEKLSQFVCFVTMFRSIIRRFNGSKAECKNAQKRLMDN